MAQADGKNGTSRNGSQSVGHCTELRRESCRKATLFRPPSTYLPALQLLRLFHCCEAHLVGTQRERESRRGKRAQGNLNRACASPSRTVRDRSHQIACECR